MPASSRPNEPYRLAIVNDYEVVVAGLRAMLLPFKNRVTVVELDVDENPDKSVDVALFDSYGQPGMGIQRIKELANDEKVGALAVYTWSMAEASRAAAKQAGARGLISKALPAETLVESIVAVARGEMVDTGQFHAGPGQGAWPGSRWQLSARESEVLALLSTGMQNSQIAQALYISENTVRTHLKAIFHKLGVGNRIQAVASALTEPSYISKHPHVFSNNGSHNHPNG